VKTDLEDRMTEATLDTRRWKALAQGVGAAIMTPTIGLALAGCALGPAAKAIAPALEPAPDR
jgi:hypothetical protein